MADGALKVKAGEDTALDVSQKPDADRIRGRPETGEAQREMAPMPLKSRKVEMTRVLPKDPGAHCREVQRRIYTRSRRRCPAGDGTYAFKVHPQYVDIEEPAPDTMVNRQTESSESDRPQRTRTIPKRFDDYVLATTNETIPKDYEEAIACEDKKHWENAMLEEIQNMYSHQVWELHTYQEALGMLMFLAVNTRPDIAYITSKLSQYSRQPKQMHWTAIKRVMRYLRGTIDLGVKFERGKTGILKSYADASWSTTHDGKSYGGYVLKLGEATIDWKSSKQPLVALSTMEAEMIAACESCCQIKWIINLLRELEEWNFMEKPTAIYTDSQSLINWISSPKQSSRCRHINRKYHFLRDCFESRDICLLYKPSQDLEADIFTKDLSRDQMKKHLESLSIVGIKPNCRCRKLSVQRQTSDNRSDIVVYDALSVAEMRVIQTGGWEGSACWKLFYILRSLEPIPYGQIWNMCSQKPDADRIRGRPETGEAQREMAPMPLKSRKVEMTRVLPKDPGAHCREVQRRIYTRSRRRCPAGDGTYAFKVHPQLHVVQAMIIMEAEMKLTDDNLLVSTVTAKEELGEDDDTSDPAPTIVKGSQNSC
ncbi:hypothetical protein LAZ67_20001540 [Cordylochernes scorpioides]|uniref:Uncharacterized protein n=1 Tax=Cordylochernes scorpioides TaxID=51811 RepID=A0ABY6LMY6_9ARAC|nr:hypothetical protein LAZ67_20001540 [Cordylochernes scorpioides]